MNEVIKTVSFGGLGDAFIVGSKLDQLLNGEYKGNKINHLFVESTQKTCELIQEYVNFFWKSSRINFCVKQDSDYINNFYKEVWKERRFINTTWHGNYHFPGPDGVEINADFALLPSARPLNDRKYDICIQVAAGANSTRSWRFDLFQFRKLIKSKGLKIALVGTDSKFIDDDPDNYVCKTDLLGSTAVVGNSKVYCGLSGFHTYMSLAKGISNIHVEESPEHNDHYIHPVWEKNRFGIKHGSLSEVMAGLRYWKYWNIL